MIILVLGFYDSQAKEVLPGQMGKGDAVILIFFKISVIIVLTFYIIFITSLNCSFSDEEIYWRISVTYA